MFINNDEFGINDFRDSFDYIYKANTIQVKRKISNDYNQNYQPGDFLGIKTKPSTENEKIIEINIMSKAPNKKEIDKSGYDDKGIVEYNGCCSYNIELHHLDIIEFITDYNYGIKAGDKFRIIMNDEGLYQGQYCFKFFTLVKI